MEIPSRRSLRLNICVNTRDLRGWKSRVRRHLLGGHARIESIEAHVELLRG